LRNFGDLASGDWDPQYIADTWINEVKWLGMMKGPQRAATL